MSVYKICVETECSNYQEIPFLSNLYRILSRVFLLRFCIISAAVTLNLNKCKCILFQFAAYLKKKNASDQQSDQKKKKKIENDSENSKEVSVGGESLDSSSMASSLEYMEGIKLVSHAGCQWCEVSTSPVFRGGHYKSKVKGNH